MFGIVIVIIGLNNTETKTKVMKFTILIGPPTISYILILLSDMKFKNQKVLILIIKLMSNFCYT